MTICVHRWRLQEPNGQPSVSGRCKYCGEERDGFASSEEAMGNWQAIAKATRNRKQLTIRRHEGQEPNYYPLNGRGPGMTR